jgi:hydrogenase maturation protease
VRRTVVIGVGNALRSDDGVGPAVADRLRALAAGVDVVTCEDEPTRLLDAWSGAEAALVVDAVSSGAAPGSVHRFDASAQALPAGVFRGSTHAFGVGETIELARALGRLPQRVVVYGVEGAGFAAGEGLSPEVEAVVEPLAHELLEEAGCTSTP